MAVSNLMMIGSKKPWQVTGDTLHNVDTHEEFRIVCGPYHGMSEVHRESHGYVFHAGSAYLFVRDVDLREPSIGGASERLLMSDQLRSATMLFFSLLDERRRRLYAGLETLKTGPSGDDRIAELLSIDVGSVARGRRELLAYRVKADPVRCAGG